MIYSFKLHSWYVNDDSTVILWDCVMKLVVGREEGVDIGSKIGLKPLGPAKSVCEGLRIWYDPSRQKNN